MQKKKRKGKRKTTQIRTHTDANFSATTATPPLKVHFPIHSGEFAALHIRLLGIRKLRALSFKLFQRLLRLFAAKEEPLWRQICKLLQFYLLSVPQI